MKKATSKERSIALSNALAFIDGEDKQNLVIELNKDIETLNAAINILLNADGDNQAEIEILNQEIAQIQKAIDDNPVQCESGQVEFSQSRIIKGQYEDNKHTVVLAFEKAILLKEFLAKIPGPDQSMHGVLSSFSFKVPMWIRVDGQKLYYNYDEGSPCPFTFISITQTTVPLSKKIVNRTVIVQNYSTNYEYGPLTVRCFYPTGVSEAFLQNATQISDEEKEQLKHINEKNIANATAAELFMLSQFSHPNQFGLNVSRSPVQKEWERRGRDVLIELGLPVDMDYPYINNYTTSVDTLPNILKSGSLPWWWSVAEHWLPIADLPHAISAFEKAIETIQNTKKTAKEKRTGITYAEKSLQKAIDLMQDYINSKGVPEIEEISDFEIFSVVATGHWCPKSFQTNISTQGISNLQVTQLYFPKYLADIYVRENVLLPEGGFAVSSQARLGMKTKGTLPKGSIQVLEVAGDLLGQKMSYSKTVLPSPLLLKISKAIEAADPLKRKVIENKQFTVDWAQKHIKKNATN